jgi:putative transcriptional regulator
MRKALRNAAALFAAFSFWSAALAQTPGLLLVAKPSLADPNFHRAVVLVTAMPDGASLGVILNRPSDQSLARLLPDNDKLAPFTEPLYLGGPVEEIGLFAVFRGGPIAGALLIKDDLYLALAPATVEQLIESPPGALRFFAGYAGWAPGQLERELALGWWAIEVDAELVFRKDTSTLWDELAARARAVTAAR